jgi:heme iron utilization protein
MYLRRGMNRENRGLGGVVAQYYGSDLNESGSDSDKGFWKVRSISVESSLTQEGSDTVQFDEKGGLKSPSELCRTLSELFSEQKLAVVATQGQGGPYGNLVAFLVSPDLRSLIFATPKATRKFSNMIQYPMVAFVIDNRSNNEDDFFQAVAVTAIGSASELRSHERDSFLELYAMKHPNLREFASDPRCALIKIDVEKYTCVFRFQNVLELYWR